MSDRLDRRIGIPPAGARHLRRPSSTTSRGRRPVLIGLAALTAALVVGIVGTTLATGPVPGSAVSLCSLRDKQTVGSASMPGLADDVDRSKPLWADEFDAPAGTPIDPLRWWVQTGGLGWGANELQAYTDDNVAYSGDGQLVITARREPGDGGARFTSARVSTCGAFEFNHGRVEARIQIPRGQGLWPAFWLLGAQQPWPQHGEIDIMESINEMRQAEFNTHQPLADGTDWELYHPSPVHPSGSWANGYHVYAVDWTSDSVIWTIDDVEYARITRNDTPSDGSWVIDRAPQTIVLNLAVGGYPGSPDATTPFPAKMKIDYVRVYANDDTVVAYRAR